MSRDQHMEELLILKTIAETLNTSNDLKPMLHHVLGELMELTGLTASWIFLSEEDTEYEFVADYNLPPGLAYNNKAPMCGSSCWCLNSYRNKKLKGAVNILNCQRLENAVEQGQGDTWNISHHATVPLRSGQHSFGLMNVAAPHKNHFSDEELALLESVALQIGSTIERTRLYALEQKRAERFASVGELVNQLSAAMEQQITAEEEVIQAVLELIHIHFNWPYACWLEGDEMDILSARIHKNGESPVVLTQLPESEHKKMGQAGSLSRDSFHIIEFEDMPDPLKNTLAALGMDESKGVTWMVSKVSTCPNQDSKFALLIASTSKELLRPADGEALDALMDAVMSARARVFLDEQRRELARLAERNRLARDLHDSVNQMLFSLSMTAKGVERLLQKNQKEAALPYIADIQQLSQDALSEMRSLILQLRPPELNRGVGGALKRYGENLGLNVTLHDTIHKALTEEMEETFYRIGQEALNNVSKHANALLTRIKLYMNEDKMTLVIEDNGQGNRSEDAGEATMAVTRGSIGLASMRERAEMAGGEFVWRSEAGKGTTVTVVLPQNFTF